MRTPSNAHFQPKQVLLIAATLAALVKLVLVDRLRDPNRGVVRQFTPFRVRRDSENDGIREKNVALGPATAFKWALISGSSDPSMWQPAECLMRAIFHREGMMMAASN
ncbi:hypothetical protein [Bradyrhizobium lupini]|uniref:hypothetical protein n=1 Tax=Rhizobium lupini TaxID=136996 RepID=UPI0034C5E191